MKNKAIVYFGILAILTFITGCQDLDEPTLGDFPLDGPVVNLITPNPQGTTSIQTPDDTVPVAFSFNATDDLGIANISLQVDGNEIYTISDFTDNTNFALEDFMYDLGLGAHTLQLDVTDTDSNVTTVNTTFEVIEQLYVPLFDGEFLYMPFEDSYDDLISSTPATAVGTPGYSGDPFAGTNAFGSATDSYIEFPINQLSEPLGNEFSGAFWYKVSGNPDRAGIIVIGDDADNRNQGFRLFREGSSGTQRIVLNTGTGTGESWNSGSTNDFPVDGEWAHIAFTISETETKVYINGVLRNTAAMSNPVDWTGCENITIGSGGPTFSYWNHLSDVGSSLDELRLFNRALTQSEITGMIAQSSQIFNMSFDGDYEEDISETTASMVGTPGYAGESFAGSDAYQGAADAYLTFPLATVGLGSEFSAVFRYKVNASPDRSGILVVGDDADDRNQGFRLFREASGSNQTVVLNVGTGSGESWNTGNLIDPTSSDWVQIAFTISETETRVYLDGVLSNTATMSNPIDFTGCTDIVIGAGGPTFSYWGHNSDESPMDELQFFNKVLSQEEIQSML